MFHSARIKLTGWYLLIIMMISLVFSGVIYHITCRELDRGFRRVEMRMRAGELDIELPLPPPFRHLDELSLQLVEDLKAARKRVVFNLLVVNGIILGISTVAGYFLAGKTLQPIEKSLEEQKRFIADASHELRTPLTALKTSMEVSLNNRKISPETRKIVKDNLEEVDSLVQLSNNLLSLANYQDNGQDLVFKSVDISRIIKSAHQKIQPLAKKKGVKINLKLKKQKIKANQESLEKMMLIFLDNAVKYTPRGGQITLKTKANRKNLIISIKDTGMGITKRDLPHIFDRFYRAGQSRTKSKVAGFGLGLSLAKKIIDLHRGAVKVISFPGKGTTFTIKLPLKS